MPTKQVTDIHNFGVIEKTLQMEVYDKLLFAPFTKDIRVGSQSNVGKASYSVPNSIVSRTDSAAFINEGTDFMLIPMLRKLQQKPKYGSQFLEGAGEDLRHLFRRVYINQMSGVVTLQKSLMDKLRTDKFEQNFAQAIPELSSWFAEQMNANFISAIYEGHSMNVTEGLNDSPDGIGVMASYHPNMYYAGSNDTVVQVGTEGKTKTQAEINSATNSTPTAPSANILYRLSEKLVELHVQKVQMADGMYWCAIINQETWHKLIKDNTIRGDFQAVASGTMYNNPFFSSKVYRWGEFLFVVDNVAARKYHHAVGFNGLNGYNELPTFASGKNNNTITILGNNSMSFAEPRKPSIVLDSTNFEQQKEAAAISIFGVSRNDNVDKSIELTYYEVGKAVKTFNAAQTVVNQSSAVLLVG